MTVKKFNDSLLELQMPFVKNRRKTLDQDDPNYVKGSDNRVKGKLVTIDRNVRKWIMEQD